MGKLGRRTGGRERVEGQLRLPLRGSVGQVRYAHPPERRALRGGHAEGSLVLGGRRVKVQRPRARSIGGQELSLPSWQEWSARDPLDERALDQMVLGVSTRRYARSLEPLGESVGAGGTSKSPVSERFVAGTGHKLAELMGRELSGFKLAVLMNRRGALRRACGGSWSVDDPVA